MATVHLLTQYAWPDDAPTGVYAEHVGDALVEAGIDAVLVTGSGRYRAGERPRPRTRLVRLEHYVGRRGSLPRVLLEYRSITRAMRAYVEARVAPGDAVVVVSAPADTVGLARTIRARGAAAVYWLQDYYPELVRGLWDYPRVARRVARRLWDASLARWDRVVKAAGNLGYRGANATTIRNWPTLDLGPPRPFVPRTALYSGNLGYGHDVASFVRGCEALRAEGFEITVRADGPGVARLPPWVRRVPLLDDVAALARSLWEAEVHLVAAHPDIGEAVFPSKVWNCLATGRRIVPTGFSEGMRRELEESQRGGHRDHVGRWVELLAARVRPR